MVVRESNKSKESMQCYCEFHRMNFMFGCRNCVFRYLHRFSVKQSSNRISVLSYVKLDFK
jgi:hypothetical protein